MEEPTNVVLWEERERALVDLARPLALGVVWVQSFLSLVYALVYGIVLLVQSKEAENRKAGVICLVLGAANVVFIGLIVALYIILVAAAVIGLSKSGI